MLPVEVIASLQPYPNDPTQDSFVETLVTIGNICHKITAAIALPIEVIGKAYSSLTSCNARPESLIARPRLPGEAGNPLYGKTKKLSYDNKCSYLINAGKVWFRPLGCMKEAKWKELGVNGNPTDQPLVAVSADGDNIIVIDDLNRLWYAKTNEIEFVVSFDCPKWKVTKEKIEWIRYFYTFPIVSQISNRFEDSTIYVNQLKNVFVSHKGIDTLFYTDMSGKKIVDPLLGTSGVYANSLDGSRFFIIDPYVRQKLMEIIGPENGRFIADNFTGAASTVAAIQRGRFQDGRTFNHCYTRFIEADELITAYPHTYDIANRTPMVRFFPSEPWLKQPVIPMREKTRLTNTIGMMQTGRGQDQRILFWEGMLYDGKTSGFYAKFIYDPHWRFIPTHHNIDPELYLSPEGIRQGPKIAFDYYTDYSSDLVKSVHLRQFISLNKTERTTPNTVIEFTLANRHSYTLRLHQLKGLKYVFGFSETDDHWTVIAPRQLADAPEVRAIHQWLMEGSASLTVNVEEQENRVRIFYRDRFDFMFIRQEDEEELGINILSSQLASV